MESIKDKLFNYLDCIEKLIFRIDKDVNNILSANWYLFFNEYSDKELIILEDIANDLSLLSFQNMILNLCKMYKDDDNSISLHKIINYLEVNYKYINLNKEIVNNFCSAQKELLFKIEKKSIYRDIFKTRDCQIAHLDKKIIASFSNFGEENIYCVSLYSALINLINPAKKIVEGIFNLFGIDKKYKRKYDNRFKMMYKEITRI